MVIPNIQHKILENAYDRDSQIFQNSRSHLKILGTQTVTRKTKKVTYEKISEFRLIFGVQLCALGRDGISFMELIS
jgi:hypothetical protein